MARKVPFAKVGKFSEAPKEASLKGAMGALPANRQAVELALLESNIERKLRADDAAEYGPFEQTPIVTSNFSASPWQIIRVNPTTGGFGIALPDPNGALVINSWVGVKNVSASTNGVIVTAIHGTIDDAASVTLAEARGFQWFFCTLNGWVRADNFSAPIAERIPTQMVFSEVFRQQWFGNVGENALIRLMPPNLQWVNDPFTDSTTGRFTKYTEAVAGTFAIAAGQATITDTAGSTRMDLIAEGVALGMPQASVMIDCVNRTGANGAYGAFLLGIVKDANNYCVANWDKVANVVQLQTKIGGVNNFFGSVSTATWAFPITLAFSVVGNWVTLYALVAGVWTKLIGKDISVYVDFKAQDHSLWFGCFGSSTPNTVTNVYTFDNFMVGRFGGVGIRDFFVVSNEDSTPRFLNTTQVQVLATMAGASGQIAEASLGVFTVDLEKKTFEQTGLIMVNRGGKIQNDHAGGMILYPNGDQRITISTYGDWPNPVFVETKLETAATQNLLAGAHIISSMTQLTLSEPAAGGSASGPWLMKRGTQWYLAYTATTPVAFVHYVVLDKSSDLSSWNQVGKDVTNPPRSGGKVLLFNGVDYVLSSGDTTVKQYDLAMNWVGIVNVVGPNDGPFPPDTMMFPYQSLQILLSGDFTTWPAAGGVDFSWGRIRWFASPRY